MDKKTFDSVFNKAVTHADELSSHIDMDNVMDVFDKDKDGKLNPAELGSFLNSESHKYTQQLLYETLLNLLVDIKND